MSSASTLKLQDYLKAASDASQRSRSVALVMVIASILVAAGELNSLDHSWMLQRIRSVTASNPAGMDYARAKLDPSGSLPADELKRRREEFYAALLRTYTENTFIVHVPVLGITFDVNDLAMIGGFSFLVLLTWFQFAITRELDNLRICFKEAKARSEMSHVYNLLSMRQVLTAPPGEPESSKIWMMMPKVIIALPLIVLTSVITHDVLTLRLGTALSDLHTLFLFMTSAIIWAFLLALTATCYSIARRIDREWHHAWHDVKNTPPGRVVGAIAGGV